MFEHVVHAMQCQHTAHEELGSDLRRRVRLPAGERAHGRTQRAIGQWTFGTDLAVERFAARHTPRECLFAGLRVGALQRRHCRFHLVTHVPWRVQYTGIEFLNFQNFGCVQSEYITSKITMCSQMGSEDSLWVDSKGQLTVKKKFTNYTVQYTKYSTWFANSSKTLNNVT